MAEIRPNIDEGIDRKDLTRLQQRFLMVNNKRIERANCTLSSRQQLVLRLLPLLLHTNHPLLPGYVSGTTPAGFTAYEPTSELVQEAQGLARSFVYRPARGYSQRQLYSLFLMGSSGSIGYVEQSDMDFWLCYDPVLDPQSIAELRRKCDELQLWAASMGAEIHIFLIDPQQFASGEKEGQLTSDDCGTTQHYLLLDEFYRTAVWLAGRTPIWWYVPVYEEHRYAEYCKILLDKRFVRQHEVVDLGHLARIPAGEFVSAGMWQLYKGIEAPYKSLLKLLLIEVYASEYPNVDCISLQFKQAIYQDTINFDELDAYVMLYRRLAKHLTERGENERLELMRRCFYLKVEKKLTQGFTHRNKSWQRTLLEKLTQQWQWSEKELQHLDGRDQWKTMEVQVERRLLVSELMYSYRFLSQLAQRLQVVSAINARDLAILGRRLYAAFERKADKVEFINPGIAPNLAEDTLTLVECFADDRSEHYWALYPGSVTQQNWRYHTPLKRMRELMALLVWAHFNAVVDAGTRISVLTSTSDLRERELYGIFQSLRQNFALPLRKVSETELLSQSYPVRVLLLVNVGVDPLPLLSQHNVHIATEQTNVLDFSGRRENLVLTLEHIVINNWNEMLVRRFSGESALLDCLAALLNEYAKTTVIPDVQVECFCRNRARAISQRVSEVVIQAFMHARNYPSSRYLLQVQDYFQILELKDGVASQHTMPSLANLETYLGRNQAECLPWQIDEYSLQGHALKYILPLAQPHKVQVYYRIQGEEAEIYVLDERNSLFKQRLEFTTEQALLMPLQRFFTALQYRRFATEVIEQPSFELPYQLEYYRLWPDGTYAVQRVEPAQPALLGQDTFYSVQAIISSAGAVTLYCNHQEFTELEYGDKLYEQVAGTILAMRRSAEPYPCYITDLDLSRRLPAEELQTVRFLKKKAELERRLNTAMQTFV